MATTMRVRVGCEFNLVSAAPTHAVIQVEPSRTDRAAMLEEQWTFSPDARRRGYRDMYGNLCQRLDLPAGAFSLRYDALVEVPAGVDDGQRLRLAGRGPAAPRGGLPGDLYVSVRVAAHPDFERHGDDLLHVRRVSVAQAALGARLAVAGLDGEHEVLVPPGTQPGQLFRVKHVGIPSLRGRGRGDLLVRVDVDVPTRLSEEEADLLCRLAELRGEEIAPPDKGVFSKLRSAFQ
jgi:DnaJ-class molecular chaperone